MQGTFTQRYLALLIPALLLEVAIGWLIYHHQVELQRRVISEIEALHHQQQEQALALAGSATDMASVRQLLDDHFRHDITGVDEIAGITRARPLQMLGIIGLLGLVTAVMLFKIVDSRLRLAESHQHEALLNEAKFFTNALLRSALQARSLEEEMQLALEMILDISWVSIQAKGSIFLHDEVSGDLVMVAHKDLAPSLLQHCARIRPGQCLCGRAASSKEMLFTNCLDERHEIRYEGIQEHGHICVPLMKGEEVLGVLNLYVDHHHPYSPLYKEQMSSISYVLAEVIERRKLDRQLQRTLEEVERKRQALERERSIVEDVLMKIRAAEDFDGNGIRYLMESVDKTAGDLLLSSRRPDGVRHFLIGDFTGHGLPAALASPAVADIFYTMTLKGIPPETILLEINSKLCEKLPSNLFFAACFIEFNEHGRRFKIWNCGLPDQILLRGGSYWRSHPSDSLALGIIEEWEPNLMDAIDLQPGDRIYAFSDGVLEISSPDGELFGAERLQQALCDIVNRGEALETLLDRVAQFHGSKEHQDDITLLEVTVPA